MATKTITLELDAYEKLKAAKLNSKESFSQVVRRLDFPKKVKTGADLLTYFEAHKGEQGLGEEAYRQLMEEQNHPIISPSHWDDV